MRQLNYKLIVSDFDGTLLTSDNKIPERVRAAINEYVACGGIFAVCTGRMLRSILPRVKELGLKGLVAAYQGTVIADVESGKIIKDGGMSCAQSAEVCRCIEGLGRSFNIYCGDTLYTSIERDNKYLKLYEKITGVEANCVSEQTLSDFVLSRKLCCHKAAVLVMPAERDAVYQVLSERLGARFDVTCSAEVLVEVSPLGETKGEALKYIANRFGISLENTVAVGDNLNDLPMIKAAGVGVAVGNADKRLKDAADYVTVTNNECAVAKIIEEYGFKQYYV